MKPRIIITMHYLELGGAEMALIGLLHALDPDKVDVDLFIYSHQGPLMKYIPDWVNLLPEYRSYSYIEKPLITTVRAGHWGVALGRISAKLKYKRFRKKHPAVGDDGALLQFIGDNVTPFLPHINPDIEYDLCISFLTPHNIARDKIRARKKIAWIHTDYSTVEINPPQELKVWNSFDKIISISSGVTNAFLKTFPSLEEKVVEMENILPQEYIKKRSEEQDISIEFTGKVNLLSIGRFCEAKNYDNVPDIARRMIEAGAPDYKWYLIGYGGDENLIREKIREAGMEEVVIILGKKDNPYPYIKACDIYVQPSRYEGKSVTVREAQILGKPVAITDYPTAKGQINHKVDGVIVPLDNEGCARGLVELMSDCGLQKSLVEFCINHNYANQEEIEKLYKIL